MRVVDVATRHYQQFDADPEAELPAASYGGWSEQVLPLDLDRTALVVMHAWDTGDPKRYPGWYRAVDYLPRASRIADEVFPVLLPAARAARLQLIHVVGGPDYYSHEPGYREVVERAGEPTTPRQVEGGQVHAQLRTFRHQHVHPGEHNLPDIHAGQTRMGFTAAAAPHAGEPIVASTDQLDWLCRDVGIDHLIYVGFAINGCLLIEPCGMVDMQRRGYLCSTIPEAVTAIENRESIDGEQAKHHQLWHVALLFGFVYALDGLLAALAKHTA